MQANRGMCEGIGRYVVVHTGVRMLLLCFIYTPIVSLGSMRERQGGDFAFPTFLTIILDWRGVNLLSLLLCYCWFLREEFGCDFRVLFVGLVDYAHPSDARVYKA